MPCILVKRMIPLVSCMTFGSSLHGSPAEILLKPSPALVGDKIALCGGVPLAVGSFEDAKQPVGPVLVVGVLLRPRVTDPLPDVERSTGVPGEVLPLGGGVKVQDADNLLPRLTFQNDAHDTTSLRKVILTMMDFSVRAHVGVCLVRMLH